MDLKTALMTRSDWIKANCAEWSSPQTETTQPKESNHGNNGTLVVDSHQILDDSFIAVSDHSELDMQFSQEEDEHEYSAIYIESYADSTCSSESDSVECESNSASGSDSGVDSIEGHLPSEASRGPTTRTARLYLCCSRKYMNPTFHDMLALLGNPSIHPCNVVNAKNLALNVRMATSDFCEWRSMDNFIVHIFDKMFAIQSYMGIASDQRTAEECCRYCTVCYAVVYNKCIQMRMVPPPPTSFGPWSTHVEELLGKTRCPFLKCQICGKCGATGQYAHAVCPQEMRSFMTLFLP
ncbi:unnamed protein product [Caenorhabditis bovis]|uniref:Nanos-type domain-containing protein n=1 Tax=Caenorhabditis bovis TaxID=2654633 RepID=A0A8S1EAL3_9PELO|nr:unnamed protein product [Caenorhabditis bovis]